MGVRASLTQIPSEIPKLLKEARKYKPSEHTLGTQYDWNSFPSVTLDKAWQDFVVVFKKIDPPLHYAIEGDYSHPSSLETWDYETSDYYTGYVSKEHVQGISSALSKLSYSDISSAFDQAGIEYDEYNQRYFEDLISFYQEAAKKHSAVMILIA